jgi:hypothetical protein
MQKTMEVVSPKKSTVQLNKDDSEFSKDQETLIALRQELAVSEKQREEQKELMKEIISQHSIQMQRLRQEVLERQKNQDIPRSSINSTQSWQSWQSPVQSATSLPSSLHGVQSRPSRRRSTSQNRTARSPSGGSPNHRNMEIQSRLAREKQLYVRREQNRVNRLREQEILAERHERERKEAIEQQRRRTQDRQRVPWVPNARNANEKFNRIGKSSQKPLENSRSRSTDRFKMSQTTTESTARESGQDTTISTPWIPNAKFSNSEFNARASRSMSLSPSRSLPSRLPSPPRSQSRGHNSKKEQQAGVFTTSPNNTSTGAATTTFQWSPSQLSNKGVKVEVIDSSKTSNSDPALAIGYNPRQFMDNENDAKSLVTTPSKAVELPTRRQWNDELQQKSPAQTHFASSHHRSNPNALFSFSPFEKVSTSPPTELLPASSSSADALALLRQSLHKIEVEELDDTDFFR